MRNKLNDANITYMLELIIVSLIWSFSFGLIKHYLGSLDSNFVAFVRMALALVVFLPFLRLQKVPANLALRLTAIGGLQIGVMYVAYIHSFQYLASFEVALFTIFTPLWITLLDGLLTRKLNARFHLTALIAITGAAVIVYREEGLSPALTGLILVQVANFAFGAGQVIYRRTMLSHPDLPHRSVIGFVYTGAVLVTLAASAWTVNPSELRVTAIQASILVYLGVVAGGLGFLLWNRGTTKVSAGVLAVMNNGYIPLAVLAGMIFYGEESDPLRLTLGSAIIVGALLLNRNSV